MPSLSKVKLASRDGGHTRNIGSSGGFFGQKKSWVEGSNANGDDPNQVSFHKGSRELSPASRTRDKTEISQVAPDVLFLKRLLYLKASIDNEPTVSTYAVPFQEEKMRDQASPEQLMLNTAAVTS